MKVLGFEVNKPSKFLIKILSTTEYIESDSQSIEASKIDNLII